MARASVAIIEALRQTASRLALSEAYEWGHMGGCNCGHLAQTITHRTRGEIHRLAMERYGDWEQQLIDYCPQSGLPLDEVIDEMLALGFTRQDLAHLERLSDPAVLAQLPPEHRYPRHNVRDDAVRYLRAWASLLEQELLEQVELPEVEPVPAAFLVHA